MESLVGNISGKASNFQDRVRVKVRVRVALTLALTLLKYKRTNLTAFVVTADSPGLTIILNEVLGTSSSSPPSH